MIRKTSYNKQFLTGINGINKVTYSASHADFGNVWFAGIITLENN